MGNINLMEKVTFSIVELRFQTIRYNINGAKKTTNRYNIKLLTAQKQQQFGIKKTTNQFCIFQIFAAIFHFKLCSFCWPKFFFVPARVLVVKRVRFAVGRAEFDSLSSRTKLLLKLVFTTSLLEVQH